MADNVKIVGRILNTTQVSRFDISDLRLITAEKIKKNFNTATDYIEYHVSDVTDNVLGANYNYLKYKLPSDYPLSPSVLPSSNTTNTTATGNQVGSFSNLTTSSSLYPIIEIDPVQDLQDLGYSSGEFKVQYNLFKNRISGFPSASLFIKEISPDRTEIRVGSVILSDNEIESKTLELIDTYNTSTVFDPFLLNFGNNIQEIVTNIVLNKADTGYEILFKLYNVLDPKISTKSSLWVVEEISIPYVFSINLDTILAAPTGSFLKGPNFNNVDFLKSNTTTNDYKSLSNINADQNGLNNLGYNQSILNSKTSQSINININFSGNNSATAAGFDSFVTFGSALTRVNNFYTKVQQIETYNNLISQYTPNTSTTSSLQSEINSYTSSINEIISNFDAFENYLYFESGSFLPTTSSGIAPYPKSGSNKPYILYPSTNPDTITWYNYLTGSAESYDATNVNYFRYTVPSYLIDDTNNDNYLVFLNMMGQFFDNIWIYIKSITDVNLANNNLNIGISKDIVYSTLQSLGVNVYNSFGNQDIIKYLIGANTGSNVYTSSLDDFSYTSSYLNNVPKQDLLAESYKRIYHNLPLLLQRKGTVAGLRTLLTTFGIPNRTYYTIYSGSLTSSFYTATGSILSTSSLDIFEYGGSTAGELLKGYNNNKVRIITNTVTGSVLSSQISIQQYSSESSKFLTADDHYVDVSFSPQTQIDLYISKSISSVNPKWLLDDYIGDPRQLYSSSYDDLTTQRNIYFNQGTGSYPGFTGSLLDYNGFIRLIQFFDNSLFKMLEDNTPARTSITTGVTINSPVLERNKWSYARPNKTTNESVKTAGISNTIDVVSPYDNYYNYLTGSKTAYFNGNIGGNEIDIYQDYFDKNFNPYLYNTSSYNNFVPANQQLNYNNFVRSDFNVLFNNITNNERYSTVRRKLEISGSSKFIGRGTFNILTTASLQDSYLSLDSYNLPRYDGVKVSSLDYNTYTSASSNYSGDKSYGKTAAIDHYVRKFGLFTQIVSSSFLPSRNSTSLKYLVDESGSLTELNQTIEDTTENHWSEIQNTFKLGKNATVALFDNQKFSNQKTTDGPKTIFDSGYSYYPILYYTGSDQKLYFQYVGNGKGILMHINNGGYFISGSTPLRYTASAITGGTGSIYSIFDTVDPDYSIGNNYYYNARFPTGYNSTNSFPTYSVPQNANMAFSANFGISIQFAAAAQSASYKFDIIASGSSLSSTTLATQTQTFTSSIGNLSTTLVFNVRSIPRDFSSGDQVTFQLRQFNVSTGNFTASLLSTGDKTPYDGLRNTLNVTTNGINPFATGSGGFFVSSSNGVDTFILNQSLTSFRDYLYLPLTSSVSLHNVYGNVDYTFSPKIGDVILVYYNGGRQYQEFNINNVYSDPNNNYKLALQVTPNIVSNLSGSYNSTTVDKLLILTKQPDETNINLSFDKEDGQTSYGFLIPSNLSPDILKNIDKITKEVKLKVSTDQSTTISNIRGGSF